MTRRLLPMLEDPETPSLVRDVLRSGRDEAVGDYDYEAGLARHLGVIASGVPMPDWAKGLEGAGGSGGAATTATATGAGASAVSSAVAWVVVPVVAAAVVAGALWSSAPAPTATPPATVPTVGLHPAQQVAPTPVPAPAVPAVANPVAAGETDAQPVAPAPAEQPQAAPAPRARTSRANVVEPKSRAVQVAPASSAPAASAKSVDLFANAPRVTRTVDPAPSAAREQPVREADGREQAAAPEPQAPARMDDSRLEREMGMLAVAQRVLASDPARTLNLMRQSAREFGDTMFAPERGQLELLALVKLGRIDEAKRLARPYLARYPNGPFSDRVRHALASGRVDR